MEKLKKDVETWVSEYTTMEILNMLSSVTGLPLSKTQINYAREVDEKNAKNEETVKEWENEGVRVCTVADIPDFVKGLIVERLGVDADEWIRNTLNSLSKSAEVREQFAICRGHCYFTVEGYVFIVMRSAYFLSNEERKQWVSESNLFNDGGYVK
jgi:hypothetical protein